MASTTGGGQLSEASSVASFVHGFVHHQQCLLHLYWLASSFNINVVSVGVVFVCRRQWWRWLHSLLLVASSVALACGGSGGFIYC